VRERNDQDPLFLKSEKYGERIPLQQNAMGAVNVTQESMRRPLDFENRCVEFGSESGGGS
jgi:hypothetical protein